MNRVRKIASPAECGACTGKEQQAGGLRLVQVRWDAGSVSMIPEKLIEPVPEGVDGLDDHISNLRFGHVDDLRRLLTFEKLKGALHDFIYSMDAARIQFMEYQYKPVLKFIDSPTERLLIADEVGLGKTIEASLIWLELQARRNARRLLVVCPGMLAEKWKTELREKFGIAADIITPTAAADQAKFIHQAGRHSPAHWIVTYTSCRPMGDDWEVLGDAESDKKLTKRGRFLKEIRDLSVDDPFFDLVVFDEAHVMRNSETSTSRLGRILSECTRALLCVSATPVNNKSDDLFSLLRLLDEDFFSSRPLFDLLLDENAPAISAMNTLMKSPLDLPQLRESLGSLKQSSMVGNLPALSRTIELADTLNPDDRSEVVRLQGAVEDLNVLGSYVSRTRRRQVKERRAIRRVKVLPVHFSEPEKRFYRGVTTGVRLRVEQEGGNFSIFHLITPQLRMASCIPAMIDAYRDGRLEDLDYFITSNLDSDEDENTEGNTFKQTVEQLTQELREYDFAANDSKYNAFKDYILKELNGEKAVLFSFFKGTLFYLLKRLRTDGIKVDVIHGGINQEERNLTIQRFRETNEIQILLSSEVGSEGIDLQFCHVMVNYDLPWNPMRVEQRIGRIDRVGQNSEVLTIVHFKAAGTIEERLYDKLHKKLGIFENSLGDLEAVLGEETERLGRELLSRQLSEEEESRMIDQTELAIESRLKQMEQLEQSGSTLIAHGDFIADRVGTQRGMKRYISPLDLDIYVKDFFGRNFPGCREGWNNPLDGTFTFDLTIEAADSLADFISRGKHPSHPGISHRKVWGTFDPRISEEVFQGKKIPLHNHLSPFIRWMTQRNEHQPGSTHPLSAFSWSTDILPSGLYAYRLQRWTLQGLRKQEYLSYALVRLGEKDPFPALDAEKHVGEALQQARRWSYPELDSEHWRTSQECLKASQASAFDKECYDFQARNETLLQVQVAQVNRHFDRRLDTDKRRLETMREKGRRESVIRLVETNMEKDRERRNHRLEILETRAAFIPEVADLGAGIIKVEAAQ
jgi:superfamily II DNA or RNA helicase